MNKLFMMMNNKKKQNKQHNKKRNQETKLREDINSEREEQSVKPNNETTPKDFVGINPLTHPTSSHYLQRNGDFVPTTHSTLSTLEPNSKYPNYDSQELINTQLSLYLIHVRHQDYNMSFQSFHPLKDIFKEN